MTTEERNKIEVEAGEQEELDNYDFMFYRMWEEWVNGLLEIGHRDERSTELFRKLTGATLSSPLCLQYEGFLGGLEKGLELAEKLKSI